MSSEMSHSNSLNTRSTRLTTLVCGWYIGPKIKQWVIEIPQAHITGHIDKYFSHFYTSSILTPRQTTSQFVIAPFSKSVQLASVTRRINLGSHLNGGSISTSFSFHSLIQTLSWAKHRTWKKEIFVNLQENCSNTADGLKYKINNSRFLAHPRFSSIQLIGIWQYQQ